MAMIAIEVPDGLRCKDCLYKGPGWGKFKDWEWCSVMKNKLPDSGAKLDGCLRSEVILIKQEKEDGNLPPMSR